MPLKRCTVYDEATGEVAQVKILTGDPGFFFRIPLRCETFSASPLLRFVFNAGSFFYEKKWFTFDVRYFFLR